MSDSKSTVRYVGYRSPSRGGGFDFSCGLGAAKPSVITIEASFRFFQGPDRIVLQEAAGMCYETLKCRLQTAPTYTSDRFRFNICRCRSAPEDRKSIRKSALR